MEKALAFVQSGGYPDAASVHLAASAFVFALGRPDVYSSWKAKATAICFFENLFASKRWSEATFPESLRFAVGRELSRMEMDDIDCRECPSRADREREDVLVLAQADGLCCGSPVVLTQSFLERSLAVHEALALQRKWGAHTLPFCDVDVGFWSCFVRRHWDEDQLRGHPDLAELLHVAQERVHFVEEDFRHRAQAWTAAVLHAVVYTGYVPTALEQRVCVGFALSWPGGGCTCASRLNAWRVFCAMPETTPDILSVLAVEAARLRLLHDMGLFMQFEDSCKVFNSIIPPCTTLSCVEALREEWRWVYSLYMCPSVARGRLEGMSLVRLAWMGAVYRGLARKISFSLNK